MMDSLLLPVIVLLDLLIDMAADKSISFLRRPFLNLLGKVFNDWLSPRHGKVGGCHVCSC
jgi:hypothetical protein